MGATLRQLDWRFLLGGADRPFDHLVWLGGTPELAEWTMNLSIARSVSFSNPVTRPADALVISRGADHLPNGLASCLRPGGSLYCEMERNARSCIARPHLQVYWTAPGAAGPSAYLPLGRGGPASWYARAPAEPLDLRTRLRALVAGWFQQNLVAPERAVVAAPHSVSARLSTMFGGGPIRWALLTTGTQDRNSVVFLPFERGRTTPLAAVKTVRLPDQVQRLQTEQRLLYEVRSALTAELRRTIPEPLGLTHVGSLTLGMQSYCAGRSLAVVTGDWATPTRRKLADLRLAANWLTALHRQTQVRQPPWTVESIGRWVEQPIRRYESRFGPRAGEQQLFSAARARAERLLGTPLPLVRQHNDFDPWNVHRSGCQLGVFDWERSALGPPLADLLYFVTIWSSLAHRLDERGAQARDFERLYLDPGDDDPLVRAAHEVLGAYMARLSIPRSFLPLLLVMMVVERALDGSDLRRENRQVRYLDVLARQHERVFSDSEVCWGWAR